MIGLNVPPLCIPLCAHFQNVGFTKLWAHELSTFRLIIFVLCWYELTIWHTVAFSQHLSVSSHLAYQFEDISVKIIRCLLLWLWFRTVSPSKPVHLELLFEFELGHYDVTVFCYHINWYLPLYQINISGTKSSQCDTCKCQMNQYLPLYQINIWGLSNVANIFLVS